MLYEVITRAFRRCYGILPHPHNLIIMTLSGEAKLLRIFTGSQDKAGQTPLYEFIVYSAKRAGLAGATVLQGVMGFGANSRVHSAKLLTLSSDLPMVIEIVDEAEKIDQFVDAIRITSYNVCYTKLLHPCLRTSLDYPAAN